MKRSVTLSRYLSWIVIIFFILLVSAGFSSLWTLNSIMQNSFMELNELSSILVSSRLEEFFLRSKDSMAHLVHMLERPDLYQAENLQSYLDDTIREFQFIDTLEVLGSDHRVIATAPAEPDNLHVSRKGEKVYEAVLQAGTAYWSDSYISLKSNQPAITFGFTTGSYVVLMDINLRWFSDFTSRIQAIQDKNFEIRLTDGNGVFIYHADMLRVFQRERQSDFPMIRDNIDGRKSIVLTEGKQTWFVAAQALTGPDWYVLVMYPRDNFLANLYRSLAGLAGFSALAAVMGVLFWRMRLKKITNAFSAISTEADRIARGDYGQLANFGEGFTEFRRIGDSLDQMVGAVGSRESTLRDRERGFRAILESIELVAVIMESDGIIRYINPFALRLLGYTREELLGQHFRAVFCTGNGECPFNSVLKGTVTSNLAQSILRTKTGGTRIIDWSVVRNLDADGQLSGSTGIGHDTTELIYAKESVEKSLKEKDVLLQEIHHRVKNNLQIITSLLSLQEAETGNNDVLRALEDAGARIQSIALVHELLYDSKDFGELDFRTYLESLTIHQLNRNTGEPIKYSFNFKQFPLSLTDAVPCGLIVNEAITNSLKHGFPLPDHHGPRIEFSGGLVQDGLARIEIRDNGVGIDDGFEYKEGKHLGLTIMHVLADQIKGKLRIYREYGTVVELVFKPGSTKSATHDLLP